MISKTIGFRDTNHFQTHPHLYRDEIPGIAEVSTNSLNTMAIRRRRDVRFRAKGGGVAPVFSANLGAPSMDLYGFRTWLGIYRDL